MSEVGEMRATLELSFRVMGSDAHVIVVGHEQTLDALTEQARQRIEQLEQRWSRFLPTSEVSRLNARAGNAVAVSDDTMLLVERAVEAWRETGGSVDATVLAAVIRAGYDRSLDLIRADNGPRSGVATSQRTAVTLPPGCTDIEIDRRAGTVRLPAGSGFDPGGMGKGLAADVVATELIAAGAEGACINLGGDLRVLGESPQGGGWTVSIDHPWSDQPIARIGMFGGAIATSTTLLRRWSLDGRERHHLIDPNTGEPSDSDLTQVSVIAGHAWKAEALAKAVLLRGAERAFDLLEPGIESLAVDQHGGVHATPGLAAFLGDVALPDSLQPVQ